MTQSKKIQFDFKIAQNAIFKALESNYKNFIDDIRTDLKDGFTTEFVDLQFLEQLFDIIHDEDLDQFTWANFHWSLKLNDLVYIIQLHEEILAQDDFNESNEDFTEIEQELFSFWQESPYVEIFQKNLEEGLSLVDTSDSLIPLLENEIISFYVLHINQYRQDFTDPIIYMANEDFGDNNKEIFLPFKSQLISFDKPIASFPSVILYEFIPEKKLVLIENEESGKIQNIKINSNNDTPNSLLGFLKFFKDFNPRLNNDSEPLIDNFMSIFNLVLSNYSVSESTSNAYSDLVESFLKTYDDNSFATIDPRTLLEKLKKDLDMDKNIKNFLTAIIRTGN